MKLLAIIIHCSKKLSSFIGSKNIAEADNDHEERWNGHLIPINGRKCLLFTHKETLYTLMMPDVLKKDLKRFNELFFDTFLTHLRADGIDHPPKPEDLRQRFGSVVFLPTDNDQKTLGTLRDHIECMKFITAEGQEKLSAADHFAKNHMNETPLGPKQYKSGKKLMREKLQSHA